MRRFAFIVTAILAMLTLPSCNNRVGDITVRDIRIDQVVPESLHSVRFTVAIEQHNAGVTIKVNTMEGKLLRDGNPVGSFTLLQPVSLTGPGSCWADINARAELADGINLLSAFAMVKEADPSRYSVSFVANVNIGRGNRNIKRDNVPLEKIVKFANSRQ